MISESFTAAFEVALYSPLCNGLKLEKLQLFNGYTDQCF